MHHEIEKNIHNLLESISNHSKKSEFNTKNIIAVSKKKSFEDIKIAYSYGLRSFGENYAQELEKKNVLSTEPTRAVPLDRAGPAWPSGPRFASSWCIFR